MKFTEKMKREQELNRQRNVILKQVRKNGTNYGCWDWLGPEKVTFDGREFKPQTFMYHYYNCKTFPGDIVYSMCRYKECMQPNHLKKTKLGQTTNRHGEYKIRQANNRPSLSKQVVKK